MSRRISAALALAVVGGLLLAPQALPASASTPLAADGATVALPPARPAAGHAWIDGLVQDRAQRYLDGVNVEAFRADDLDGDPVASWITYEDPEDGPAHGWFRLYGLEAGVDYEVRFSSLDDDADPYRASWFPKAVRLTNRQVLELPTTTLTLQRKVTAKLTAAFAHSSVKPATAARLKISLTSPDVKPVIGDLRVKIDGSRAWSTPLKTGNNGHTVVSLPKLKLGTHKVAVTFGGNDAVMKSKKATTLELRVTRNGR